MIRTDLSGRWPSEHMISLLLEEQGPSRAVRKQCRCPGGVTTNPFGQGEHTQKVTVSSM